MGRLVAVCLALACGACDIVYDLHRDDAPVAPRVVGRYHHTYVTNDATFAPRVVDEPFAANELTLTVILDDGTQPAVTYNAADGTFSFERMGDQAYRVIADAADTVVRYHTASATPDLAHKLAGRPDAPLLNISYLQFPYPPPPEPNAVVATTGQYSMTNTLMRGDATNMIKWDWRLATPLGGRPLGMLRSDAFDRVYVMRFDDITNTTLPYKAITKLSSGSVDLIPNGTGVLPQPEVVPRDECTRLISANTAERDRMLAAAPRTYVAENAEWLVQFHAAPEHVGAIGALYTAVSQHTPAMDLDVAPRFVDPFTGMTLVMETGVILTLQTALDGSAPISHNNVSRRYVRAERGVPDTGTGCSAGPVSPPTTTIPGRFALDGQSLGDAATDVTVDGSHDPRLTWENTADGDVDYYAVSLIELVDVAGTTGFVNLFTTLVAGQQYTQIESALLVPGKTYLIQVNAQVGRPNATSGDFSTIQLPYGGVQIWSYPFTIH